jgi:aminopeptidase N
MLKTDTGQIHRLEDYRPTPYHIPEVSLLFRLDPNATAVTAELVVERRPETDPAEPLVLDGDGLKLTGLRLDGQPLPEDAFQVTPDILRLLRPPASTPFRLSIDTELDPSANGALMGLYRSNDIYCTQCEPEGFRRITYFLDRPDILSAYRVRIEADMETAPILLSNGNPVEAGPLAGGRHYAVWHDPFPKPSYLFALVAGRLSQLTDRFVTASGREVRLAIHVEPGKEPRAAYAMDALKRAMSWDEQVFGLEYDLDVFNIVAVSDFNMGAMENKGLNIFNDKYVLADLETATDTDFANIEAIIAHEYFHNWTGNRITCRDWFQLCLKEGLTVFRDHEFSADQRSRAVERIADVRALKSHQFPEDQGPLAHPVRPRRYREINNFYTATVYEKGAEIVRMIRLILGPETFRRGLVLYIERHDGQAVTVEDFLKAFEDVSGCDLAQFALWYHQAGTPNLAIRATHDRESGRLTLEIEQSIPATPGESRKRLLHIPLAFGLVGADGRDLAYESADGAVIENGVIHIRRRRHTIVFSGLAERPVLSVNRGFSAPVTLTFEQSLADRLFLARHDSDLFGRWDALTALSLEYLISAAREWRAGKTPEFPEPLIALFGAIVEDETLEPAYRALALTLPSEGDIAREMGRNIDPDAILAAREHMIRAVAALHGDSFASTYHAMIVPGPFSPDAASAGRRALRNVLLDYLCAGPSGLQLAARQFAQAGNMTERAAALSVLTTRFPAASETAEALQSFEKRYRDNPLVMDKWFQIQAAAPAPRAVETVRALVGHPAFDMANPNRVRSLLGTFANANHTGFHRADGRGYALIVETVLKVDKRNPQLAARLATAFRSWRSLESKRRELAREALSSMQAEPELSVDLRDIVERTLG